jgi:hypothetical protein
VEAPQRPDRVLEAFFGKLDSGERDKFGGSVNNDDNRHVRVKSLDPSAMCHAKRPVPYIISSTKLYFDDTVGSVIYPTVATSDWKSTMRSRERLCFAGTSLNVQDTSGGTGWYLESSIHGGPAATSLEWSEGHPTLVIQWSLVGVLSRFLVGQLAIMELHEFFAKYTKQLTQVGIVVRAYRALEIYSESTRWLCPINYSTHDLTYKRLSHPKRLHTTLRTDSQFLGYT